MNIRSEIMKNTNPSAACTLVGLLMAACLAANGNAQGPDSSKQSARKTGDETCTLYPLFKPGDALRIMVYPDTGVFPNGIYLIDSKGCVDLPVIGMVPVSGRTETEVEEMLKEAYIDYLRHPNVQVRPLIRASCLGGFYEPGLFYIDPRASVWNLVQLAGGTQREDGVSKLKWERDGAIISKDLVPYYQSGESLRDIGFESGDQLRVSSLPVRRGWDIFLQDVLPLLSFTATTITSSITTYLLYESYQEEREARDAAAR
ncbi:MAG: hypothetical protein GF350_08140 [Chitinivibrionales bacterium]|nr:hypothetical protein [Chitinivibrionales bacterium]